tara:strand:+ start:2383 stop:2946 length:564 start_codon:yes stop_codon:yes gene_type:complete
MEERDHILKVLKKVKEALKREDYIEIKTLSDHVIHSASANQNPDVIAVAIVIYSLSKLIERESYKQYPQWKSFYKEYVKNIDDAIRGLEKNDIETFRFEIHSIREQIQNLSGDLKKNIDYVFRRAKINKASRIYEHGISMQKTANILGVSIWELAEYAGKTGIGDVNLGITLPLKQRIKQAQDIFKK